ncbi:hypothetical protein CLV59_105192 [Chitinophaga dinghuensis]|uniref:Uncharacterized protein n=1 Tax=Chitinophaga dinghuensis TaxID=1539050 RepID=A0A327VYW4_9BACT|nr:hypothetical protein [Chitinophaga dinghuensis]RAJ80085.1 hypothetical protein CLV59_105192 [Chitinophaga dinghuensis]
MTLIASTRHNNYPFLIGDILFTSENGNAYLSLPTALGDIQPIIKELKFKPAGYWQKVYIIKPNLAIGMSGLAIEMSNLLKELRLKCNYYDDLTLEDVERILNDYDDTLFAESTLIACYIEKNKHGNRVMLLPYPNNDRCIQRTSNLFKTIISCGSGAIEFCNQAAVKANFTTMYPDSPLSAITANITFLARLLAAEMSTLQTIRNFWGAGFEMIYFDGKGFNKFENLAYVIFTAFYDKDIKRIKPALVLHYHYHNDILYYSSIKIGGYTMTENVNEILYTSIQQNFSYTLYHVLPLDFHPNDKIELDNKSFTTDKIAWCYSITSQDNSIFLPSAYTEGGGIKVEFNEGADLVISMRKDLADTIKNEATTALEEIRE